MESFVPVALGSDFPLHNLPFGVCRRTDDPRPRPCVAIGDFVVDLSVLQTAGCFSGPVLSRAGSVFAETTLNGFLELGRPAWREARATLTRLLSSAEGVLRDDATLRSTAVLPMSDVQLLLPVSIGDYTDFYTSKHHAFNCGCMFRDPKAALPPNWVHLPVGYHGRASSVVVSGTPVRRPWGQMLPPDADMPVQGPCQAVDFELEMACVMGTGNELGSPMRPAEALDSIFGLCLMNDWSARDIQKWEMVPLGPFNGKNWATQVSPWLVTLDALEPFRCEAEPQDPPVLPYLQQPDRHTWDVSLTAGIVPAGGTTEAVVTRSNLRHLYWTFPQMAAHHTAGGCNLAPGDLLGSGTVSGPSEGQRGCLFEITWGGKTPLELEGLGQQRVYLHDGDQVVLRGATGAAPDGRPGIGFGECRGALLPCGYNA